MRNKKGLNLEKRAEERKVPFDNYYPSREEEERRRWRVYKTWHMAGSKLSYEEEERRRQRVFRTWYG